MLSHRQKFFASIGAVCLAVSSLTPAAAQQSGPTLGSWTNGPGASGTSTIVGRIETPRARQAVDAGSNLLVSGWAVDTTATGWAGIKGLEVWSGAKGGSNSTLLATGTVGLTRTDISDALGASFAKSGFSAVVPGSALASMTGAQTLGIYLITPDKGSYTRSVAVTINQAATLEFPNDPIVAISKPQEGMNITQKQVNNKFSFVGFALDRNAITDPNTQLAGPGCSGCNGYGAQARGAGIANIVANIDTPAAPKGDNTIFGSFGSACTSCLNFNTLVSNKGYVNIAGRPQGSFVTRSYGSQFDFAGWTISMNPATLSPGPHTLYVTATSSITGQKSTAQVTFNILDQSHTKIQP